MELELALEIAPMVIDWPALAPTWKVAPWKLPSSRFTPLNWVCEATLLMSFVSCVNCAFRSLRSAELFEALSDSTARSRIDCRSFVTSCSAPEAVWASDTPSFAFCDGLVQAIDLRGHALHDRVAGGVIRRGIDAQARGELLQGGLQLIARCRQRVLSDERINVRVEDE